MSRRAAPSKKTDPDAGVTEFSRVLLTHLDRLGWNADDLAVCSTRYPATAKFLKAIEDAQKTNGVDHKVTFEAGISRPQAYGLVAKKTASDWRAPTRTTINILSHELAAHYEAKRPGDYSRANVEVLLADLLKAAGFASYEWINDRWDEIIDNPAPERRTVRVGFFSWPGMAVLQKSGDALVNVTGTSANLVHWLLRALRIMGEVERVELNVEDLYDRSLFLKVDLVAPLVGIPARRFALAYSNPIGGWKVGQNALVNTTHRQNILGSTTTVATHTELPQDKLRVFYVQGGVSELLVDELDKIPDVEKIACSTFADAIDQVGTHPMEKDGRFPCFVGDSVTCDTASAHNQSLVPLINNEKTMLCPLVFGLPQRDEVVHTVNEALSLLESLRKVEFNALVPKGVRNSSTKH